VRIKEGADMHRIQFSPPDISEAEIQEVAEALRSGWITTGPRTKKLEENLAAYLGVHKVVCLSSCTAAEELNFRVLGIGEGDEVIVPAYTYTASASAALHVGATIKFIDCQKDSLQMDYDALERAITEKTKAIVPVDLGGVPCDYDRIYEIAEKKKNLFHASNDIQKAFGRIIVCADGAHALGASYKGTMVGNVADFTGFLFPCREELYDRQKAVLLHGRPMKALMMRLYTSSISFSPCMDRTRMLWLKQKLGCLGIRHCRCLV
jgi:dTDP-4-amino-4,6-dideoxygalactose transaminase